MQKFNIATPVKSHVKKQQNRDLNNRTFIKLFLPRIRAENLHLC